MNATRSMPILFVSLTGLFLCASAKAQVAPGVPADSLLRASDQIIVMPPHMDPSDSLQPVSRNQETASAHAHLGKIYWIGWGLAGVFSVASIEMTAHCERQPGCSEGNPIFGAKPTRLELYAPRAAVIAAGMLLCRHWKRRDPQDNTSTIAVTAIDAYWGADMIRDAHEVATAPGRPMLVSTR
ncbi:MAG TPA: hypothetical protein VMD78_05610 [Candidatus Baltobacteraceae bacterium]|nr:hypothetical protein [Candidatus Baltobacteraceae bacterium]